MLSWIGWPLLVADSIRRGARVERARGDERSVVLIDRGVSVVIGQIWLDRRIGAAGGGDR
jgi:hypothetical protein